MDESSSESRWVLTSDLVLPPEGVKPGHAGMTTTTAFDGCGVRVRVCDVVAWPGGFGFSIEFLVDPAFQPEMSEGESLSAGIDFYRKASLQPDGRCRVALQTCGEGGSVVDGPALRYNGSGASVGWARTHWIGCSLPGTTDSQLVWIQWPDLGVPAFAVNLPGSLLQSAAKGAVH